MFLFVLFLWYFVSFMCKKAFLSFLTVFFFTFFVKNCLTACDTKYN